MASNISVLKSTSHHRNIDLRPGPSLFSMDGRFRFVAEIVAGRYRHLLRKLAINGLSRSRVSVRGGNMPCVEHLVKLTNLGFERSILGIERIFGLGAG